MAMVTTCCSKSVVTFTRTYQHTQTNTQFNYASNKREGGSPGGGVHVLNKNVYPSPSPRRWGTHLEAKLCTPPTFPREVACCYHYLPSYLPDVVNYQTRHLMYLTHLMSFLTRCIHLPLIYLPMTYQCIYLIIDIQTYPMYLLIRCTLFDVPPYLVYVLT